MEAFYKTHLYLIKHINSPIRRELKDEIDWEKRLIGIKGTRGVGKTTFLLSYAKEKFGEDRSCLYINLNNLYFTDHTIIEFADKFRRQGGKVLLIDQIFKYPDWAHDLRYCYEQYDDLKIIFTGSSVIQFDDENNFLADIVQEYFLRGLSFREYLNLKTDCNFSSYTLEELLGNHEKITETVCEKAKQLPQHFQAYLHHGFYPFFLEKRNFSENLLKTVNMMIEVDILLIKQIELKYLHKIKQLLYLLAQKTPCAPNVSQLSCKIQTSRATIMKYIQYLKDARVVNMLYTENECYPKKPHKVYLHNTNLIYALQPDNIDQQSIKETFFINAIYKGHTVNTCNADKKSCDFIIDNRYLFQIETTKQNNRHNNESIYVSDSTKTTGKTIIPLWLLGFLY